ncbi:alpha-1,4-glucan:maltose-1-phosphate maltosyltransferase [Rhodospirillales bacterium URHD0017]|nr:alpha-1,4-glucan:maltose-1-phosphate maltosyltransferase [Rhodospirillales bacterium URHD0017]
MGRCLKSTAGQAGVGEARGRLQVQAPAICYFDELRSAEDWQPRLARAADLGLDHVCLNPFLARHNDPLLISDLARPSPGLGIGGSIDEAVHEIAALCERRGLRLCLDVVLDRLASDGASAHEAGDLFERRYQSDVVDPRLDSSIAHAVTVRPDADRIASWWASHLVRLASAGATAFRLLGLGLLPAGALRAIVAATRRESDCALWAWTPGLAWSRHGELAGAGLDGVFASTAWWDGSAAWYVEELDSLARIAPVIGVAAEARSLPADVAARRRALQLAAATTDGLFLPEGFPADVEEEIRQAATDLKHRRQSTKSVRRLTGSSATVTALARLDSADARQAQHGLVVLINNDVAKEQAVPVSLDPLDPVAGAMLGKPRLLDGRAMPDRLRPGEVLMAELDAVDPVRGDECHSASAAASRSPVVIDRVAPQAPGFAVRRIIGRPITVEADIFADGHDVLAAELQWREAGKSEWQRSAMTPLGNDRWRATMIPRRVGRHFFTIEGWRDEYGSLSHALEVKSRAGVDVTVDIADAAAHLRRLGLGKFVAKLDRADAPAAVRLLTASETHQLVAAADVRHLPCRHPEIAVEVERPQAEFASWYELFPRSLGTFNDVIAHLPRVRDMGFDVLYFPPIHPIGTTNRKGRNNALKAAPDDPGSPYAIGARDGGHDAVHAALGTPEDFRRLVAAAREQGLEIAIDFAIQCSPDHPWLKQHPEWFRHRADGSIRFAENPPKKYEDIVNVDFYADGAIPELWLALRDVVLHWAGEGVRIFRVDNPHTKPLPFWEWMIADVRGRHPDVIFLAEAFTRPTMMYRLAKIGFSQSYTYFTWRNNKAEITDYLRELTTTEVADYYRPHFFVNTPDINPIFLQSSGRAGFLIRAALAATLSGLWGVYSGFELCEAAALPGREEYLDSEKYEARQRDFDAPGNIVAEITALNRLRRLHPALHSHLGVRFYNAFNDQVLVYGKPSPDGLEMILVAVSFDPHHVQEASFEVPLWEWKLPDNGAVEVEDLMRGSRFVWQGKMQRVRLDPADLPFAIWRIAPTGGRP